MHLEKKIVVSCKKMFRDQMLEQEIKELKRCRGMVGLSQVDVALYDKVTAFLKFPRLLKRMSTIGSLSKWNGKYSS